MRDSSLAPPARLTYPSLGKAFVRPLALLITVVTLAGCYVPLKWHAWRYKGDGLQVVPHWDLPIDDPNVTRFTVGDVYVHAFLKAHNETTQRGSSPYQLYVVCYVPGHPTATVTFHDVEVLSELDSTAFRVVPIEVDQRGLKVKSLAFPYSEDFTRLSATASWVSLVTDSTLALRPEKDENVRIRILVEVAGPNGSAQSWITYRFSPHLEEGEVGYIGPGA